MKTIRFEKTACGVDVLLNVRYGYEHKDIYLDKEAFHTDTFSVLLSQKAGEALPSTRKKSI